MLHPFERAMRLCRSVGRGRAVALAALVAIGAGLAGCAQQPQQMAAAGHPKEYFPSSIYGPASRRVIADGEPVPRGGGQYLVGKPYTIAGQTYYPSERRVTQVGLASWYGDAFHGRLTANGEIYDRDSFTAAHPTMPLPSYARVTNLRNNASMIVRVNDRGPYHSNRVMDVSRRVAEALDIRRYGTSRVKVEWVARASLAGSDDARLAATLRTDGPARAEGLEGGTMLAAVPETLARVASLGAFYPAPARPSPVVEEQRPDKLEAFRAPPPPRRPRADPPPDQEDGEAAPLRARALAAAAVHHRAEPEDEPSTGSIPRHRLGVAAPVRVAVGSTRRADPPIGRIMAGHADRAPQHSIPAASPPHRPLIAAHPTAHPASLPPARVAAVLPPARPHALHAPRSRGG